MTIKKRTAPELGLTRSSTDNVVKDICRRDDRDGRELLRQFWLLLHLLLLHSGVAPIDQYIPTHFIETSLALYNNLDTLSVACVIVIYYDAI